MDVGNTCGFENVWFCGVQKSIRKGRGHPELSAVASHEHDQTPDIHWQPRVIAKENETNGKVKEALRINRLEKDSGKQRCTLGQSLLTFGPDFHMYTCMPAFAKLTASHHMVKVHGVTAKHCALY